MKKILFVLAPLAIAAGMAFTLVDPLPIGSKLPKGDVKMMDVSGKSISISEAAGKAGVLVMFSCNTCPYVIKNQERTLYIAKYAQKLGVGVILINSNEAQRNGDDSFEAMQAYAKEQQYHFNYVVDKNSELADAFGANRTPECFLFNKDLTLVYHGAIDDNPADASNIGQQHLRNAIKEMTAGAPVSVTQSRSVGCSIKRVKN